MRRETVGCILLAVGVSVTIPVIVTGVVYATIATSNASRMILDHIRFEREMRKGIKEGRILKLHGEYFTILEDGTKD